MPMEERAHVSGIMKSIAMNSEMIEAVCFMDCVNGDDAGTRELRQGIFN
jgi:hypothetical protein